jgi:hypothetical protein
MRRGILKLASDRRQLAINSSSLKDFPGLEHDGRHHEFAPLRIGDSKDGRFAYRRMLVDD